MFQYPADFTAREILPFAVFSLFVLAWFMQLIFYLIIYSRLAFYRRKPEAGADADPGPVSVIICAKNEYQNILHNLPLILEQEYASFEVLVVNDASEDDSIDILNSYSRQYPHLKIFNLEQNLNFFSGKKFPLALGIKSAAHDIILLTDADCRPASREWIKKMASRFSDKTNIVLGYGPYAREKTFLNRFIRYDAFMTAFNYLSFSLAGLTYMGVGRNLAYRKELFFDSGGFVSHYRLPSGDDDLFINKVAKRRNVRIEISPEAHTLSHAKRSFSDWVRQKKRHYTTSSLYKFRFKLLLSLQYLVKLLLVLTMAALAVLNYNLVISAAALGFILITHMIIIGLAASRLREKDLIAVSPFMELIFLVVHPIVYISKTFFKPDKWN
jgi:cellulose synthase/poly-beta-1,6-N-acetylglucosamine synthase-like glycosyltransferase